MKAAVRVVTLAAVLWAILRWLSTPLACLLVGVWLATRPYYFTLDTPLGTYRAVSGRFEYITNPLTTQFYVQANPIRRMEWLPDHQTYYPSGTRLDVYQLPIWMPLAAVLPVSGLAWREWYVRRRSHRRVQAGLCASCGYDRRGLGGEVVACPECGGGA